MSVFTPTHNTAEVLRDLAQRAPAGGLFHESRISPVESHGLINGPCFFYIEVPGNDDGPRRTMMVSVQDVTPDR